MEDLVQDGMRDGSIRPVDQTLLFRTMGSSRGGIIERAAAEQDPGRRERIVDDGLGFILGGMMAHPVPGGETEHGWVE